MTPTRRPAIGVGAIVVHEGRLLVVRRGRAPATGLWSVPGGHLEWGETLAQAVEREVAEETGLRVRCGRFLLWAERIDPDHHVVIADFRATVAGDTRLRAGDDADAARWVTRRELSTLPVVDGLVALLEEHAVLAELD